MSTLGTEMTGEDAPDPLIFNSELTGGNTEGSGWPDEFSASDVLAAPAGPTRVINRLRVSLDS